MAEILGVDDKSLANWEVGRIEPALRHWRRIIRFLGYVPLPRPESFGERLTAYRVMTGRSQPSVARALGVDESTIWGWECHR
ncbi:MAG: helix-turn-helix transcriptional regulator [Gemmatimonadota bacterium]